MDGENGHDIKMNVSEDLERALSQRLAGHPNKAVTMTVAAEAMADEAVLDVLIRFVYSGEDPLRWRAAWALEKVSALCPSLLLGVRGDMRQLAMQSDTPSGLRRLLLNILYHLPNDEALDVAFFNFLLDKMCDLQSPPGVQALAMKLACRMSRVNPDLHQEFLCIVRNIELDYYSAGLRSAVRNCLRHG